MSPKELQYVEDALGHMQFMASQCQEAASTLKDPQLKQQAQQLADTNRQIFGEFINLV